MEMLDFNPEQKCPKCGGEANRRYCPGYKGQVGIPLECSERGEHLHRNCLLCSFGWLEKCLDDKAATGADA